MKDILNCPNCGAPIVDDKCSYCGAVFLDICDVSSGSLVYLKFVPDPLEKKTMYMRARVNGLNFTMRHVAERLYADMGQNVLTIARSPDIDLTIDLHGEADCHGVICYSKEELYEQQERGNK